VAAGSKLKTLRNRCNITVRQVEQASGRIAEAKGDKRFRISNGWLAQLENGKSEPSICKLFTLSVIYHADFRELARLYNVDLDEIAKYESIANPHVTQLCPDTIDESQMMISASRNLPRSSTSLMPQLTSVSDSNAEERRNIRHGYVGLNDYMMYPLIRPGALVEIDTSQDTLQTTPWHNEFERPIFFIELHEGYACGWCELQGNQLLIIPHHSSPATVRRFTYPREAEIFGRVVSYNTRCVDPEAQTIEAAPPLAIKKARK
jgi:transcriptional regulator with XRE-family HTH domain